MEKKLLATFYMEEINDTFNIYGSYEIETVEEIDLQATGNNKIKIKHPEFYNIRITKLVFYC